MIYKKGVNSYAIILSDLSDGGSEGVNNDILSFSKDCVPMFACCSARFCGGDLVFCGSGARRFGGAGFTSHYTQLPHQQVLDIPERSGRLDTIYSPLHISKSQEKKILIPAQIYLL